jgi:3-hydroxyacyl-CoA dehydrogenase / enoyl-CoA hydratase / 3-hydroxybutyryl-CoA epimerase
MLFESPSLRAEADDQIATLWIDCPNRRVNVFSSSLLAELDRALCRLESVPCLDVLVIRSAKPAHFAGTYDREELAGYETAEDWSAFAQRGQQVLERLENLGRTVRTVALIEGACEGAGLELALACGSRVAVSGPETAFRSRELEDGLIPCWGGNARLPRRVGMRRALRLLLDGEEVGAPLAAKWGLVDLVLPPARARIDFRAYLDRLQDHGPPRPSMRAWWLRWRERTPFAKARILRRAARQLAAISDDDEGAAHELIQVLWHGISSSAEGMAAAQAAVARLGASETCRIALAARQAAEQEPRIYPEPVNPIPPLPKRVGIVGGGEMGTALAAWLALRGREVVLRELDEEALARANRRLAGSFGALAGRGRITTAEAEELDRSIRRTTGWNGFDGAGLLIEAVDEELGVKHEVFHSLESQARPRTILVSASSSLRIESLQVERQRPGRVAGVHLAFEPVEAPLVEIVRAPATEPDTIAALDSWLRALGKTPLVVSDRPGRVIPRLLLNYLSEAVLIVAEGMPAELVDRAARRFGMRGGPLETIDAIGFEKIARLTADLQLARGDQFARNLLLERMRSLGWEGKPSGEGFYRYRGQRMRPNRLARMVMWQDLDEDVISHYVFDPIETLRLGVERLALRSVNEAAACLSEEPDLDPAAIDLAMAWGVGWAPQRGGPLRYADSIGLTAVVERLVEFTERYGKRFEPCLELQRRAEAGEPFYDTTVAGDVISLPQQRRLAG